MRFDDRLQRTLHHLLLGSAAAATACIGGGGGGTTTIDSGTTPSTTVTYPTPTGTTPTTTTDPLCATATGYGPEYSREPGYLAVPLGEPCPAMPDPSQLQAADCCPVLDPVAVCGYVAESTGSNPPYYGGYPYDTAAEVVTYCQYDAVFEIGDACCGRPLRLEGESTVASVVACGGWAEGCAALDGPAEAAAYWRVVAQLEHASVASFGRVALELMRFGAPADLVRRCHEAALDEVRHAELAFGVVTALEGTTAGPGPLPLPDALPLAASLADVAEGVVREGCLGETFAASDAVARLRGADGHVADALATIADDEARHAGLAWAMLRWLLEVGGEPVRARAEAVFAEGLPVAPALRQVPRGGRALGLIDDAERERVAATVWREVVLPTWASLSSVVSDDTDRACAPSLS